MFESQDVVNMNEIQKTNQTQKSLIKPEITISMVKCSNDKRFYTKNHTETQINNISTIKGIVER